MSDDKDAKGPHEAPSPFIGGKTGISTDPHADRSLVYFGALHRAPENKLNPRLVILFDHPTPLENNPHFDAGPKRDWLDFVVYHEISHMPSGDKPQPTPFTLPREFVEDNKFHRMTKEAEARDARISEVAAMLSKPVDAYDIARASLRVIFAGDMTIVDRRPNSVGPFGKDTDASGVFRLMQSPRLASDPLKAATAVAILRGDASPLRSKYNIEMK